MDPHAIATALHAEWTDAFAARDAARLARLYAPHTAFWGSTGTLYTDNEGVEAYFAGLPAGFTAASYGAPEILILTPDSFTASTRVVFLRDGAALPFRMTQILVRRGPDWLIAVHHASPDPG